MNITVTRNGKTTGPRFDKVRLTNHFIKQARHKGFTAEQIIGAISQVGEPEDDCRITRVSKHPAQRRFCGHGVAVIMEGNVAITIYADKVITPLRPDQMNDPSAINSQRLNR